MASYFTKKLTSNAASPARVESADAQVEISKLKSELELLQGVKLQNDGLKAQIHSLVADSDSRRKALEEKVKSLEEQLAANTQIPSSQSPQSSLHEKALEEAKTQKLKLEANIRKLMLALKQAHFELEEEKQKAGNLGSSPNGDVALLQSSQYQALVAEAETYKKTIREQEQQHLSSTRLLQAQLAATETQLKEAKLHVEELSQPLNPASQTHWEQQLSSTKAEAAQLEKELQEVKEVNSSQQKRLHELENTFEKVSSENSALLERLSQQQKLMRQESTVAIDTVTQEAERARQALANRVDELEQDKVVLMAQHQCALDQLKHDHATAISQLQSTLQNSQEQYEQHVKELEEKLTLTATELMEQHKRELDQAISVTREKAIVDVSAQQSERELGALEQSSGSTADNSDLRLQLAGLTAERDALLDKLKNALAFSSGAEPSTEPLADDGQNAVLREKLNAAEAELLQAKNELYIANQKVVELSSSANGATNATDDLTVRVQILDKKVEELLHEISNKDSLILEFESKVDRLMMKDNSRAEAVLAREKNEQTEALVSQQLQNAQQVFQTKTEAQVAKIREQELEIDSLRQQTREISVTFEILEKESAESKSIIEQQKNALAATEQSLISLQQSLQNQALALAERDTENLALNQQLAAKERQLESLMEQVDGRISAKETEVNSKELEILTLKAELAKVSESLEVVAQKARDESRIVGEQLTSFGIEAKALSSENAELREKISAVESQNETLLGEREELELRLKAVVAQTQDLESKLSKLSELSELNEKTIEERKELESRLNALLAQSEIKDGKLKELSAQVEEQGKTVANLRDELKRQMRFVEDFEKENEDLRSQYDKTSSLLKSANSRVEALEAESVKQVSQIGELKVLKETVDGYKHKIDASSSEAETAKRQKVNIERAMQEAVETVRNEKRAIEQRVITLEELTRQLQEERNAMLDKLSDPQAQSSARNLSAAVNDVKKILGNTKAIEQPIATVISSTNGEDLGVQLKVLKNHLIALEEEVQFYRKKNQKLNQELDNKGKLLSQYILRDNAMAPIISAYVASEANTLQSGQPPARSELNASPLSSTLAMKKMDPGLISQVNSQLQKLLEDTIQRLNLAESELKSLKSPTANSG